MIKTIIILLPILMLGLVPIANAATNSTNSTTVNATKLNYGCELAGICYSTGSSPPNLTHMPICTPLWRAAGGFS